MAEQYSEVFMKIGELGFALGMRNINQLPGCWEHQVDEQWFIALNAHAEPTKCSKGTTVPAFTAYIEFNGWPAGIVNAHGGTIAAGEAANETTLIAAINLAIREAEVRR